MIYPITSIFRTGVGPLPAYRFAPFDLPGEHALARPITILSEGKLHAVTRLHVHQYVNFVILQGHRHWTGVPDGVFTEGMQLDVCHKFMLRLTDTEHRIDTREIINTASIAAMHCCSVNAGGAAKFIDRLALHEFRTEPLAPGEYGQGLRFTLPVVNMRDSQFHIFLYAFLCVCFRFFKFKKNTANKNVLILKLKNLFWRDYVATLCLMLGLHIRMRIERDNTFIHFDQAEFAEFVKDVFRKMPDMPYRDFKMAYSLLGSHVVSLDENLTEIANHVDNVDQPSVEKTEYAITTATCPGVSFPEIPEFVEANSMIVRPNHERDR